MDVKGYLNGKGFKYITKTRHKGPEAILNCPFCGDKDNHFGVSIADGAFQCLRKAECGRSGSWYELQKLLGDKPLPIDGDKNYIRREKVYKKPVVHSDKPNDRLYEFFDKRKIKKETVKHFHIGIKDNNIMIPHFEKGELIFVKYRSLDKKEFWNEKDAKPILFNMDTCEKDSVLRIFEGQMDVMAAYQYGIDGVSVPNGTGDNSWIETCWDYIDKFKTIHLFFDDDKDKEINAGQECVDKIVKRLGEWRCFNVTLPKKDMNDCLMSNIGIEEIIECEKNAKEYTHDNLKKADYFRDRVKDLNSTKEKKYGNEIGIKGLNIYLGGWREGDLTVIHGHEGSGKSTFVSQEILFQIKKGFVCCMASLELPPERYLNWMCNQYSKKGNVSDDDIDNSFDFFGSNLIVVNRKRSIPKDDLFEIFSFAARKYNSKYFLLDSMMRMKFDNRYELNDQKNFIEDCKNFAMEYQCHFFLIAHARKGNANNSVPDLYDILGTSTIGNTVDNAIAIWRPKPKSEIEDEDKKDEDKKDKIYYENDAMLYLQKNREHGKLNKIKLFFNPENRLFVEAV